MSDPSVTQTQTDLKKLRQLIDDLGEVVDRQHQTIVGTRSDIMMQASGEIVRLLTPVKLTLEALARRVETQEKERQQLRALQEVGAVINSSLDKSEVLNTVMDTIIQLTGAERGFLMLFDEETGELGVEVARNINRETIEESSFEISRSIVRSVAETGVPVVTTNAQADPRFASQESIISYNLRSILCVPLKIRDDIIGVIYADNRIVSGIFVDTDRDLLTAFANQAAVAIDNARLFRQIRDQLADITEMKNLQDDVFESIASGVITIDTADRISLYNRAAERILGVPSHQVLEQKYQAILAPMGRLVENMIQRIRLSGGYFNVEIDAEVNSRPGSTTLNLSFSPLRDIQQETLGVAMVLDDISEKKRLESVRRYLPPALVDQVRDLDAAQRPQRRDMSVLFADVRGFSTISEFLEPELLIELINGYFTIATEAISANQGLIDKFMGDAVMALFNTPLNPQNDHCARAVRTALAMRNSIVAYHEAVPEDKRLGFGVGIHTGEAVVGNVGSELRKDYSAIGDAVNLAKRLQEMARPDQVILSEAAYERVKEWVTAEKLEPVQVKGRQALEQIYELTGLKEP
ncbi:MAG: GAF domain-containing protein [Chloroflexi bacterium]|nr:GAF domain-containing protein [Chloroflexota bacterium]MCI0580117.1 GAF domain-containing protein [Chloroflexota bacterium]MCI0649307.1 GAF domain-containing protein [Chloroflexota bacterium]MCI0725960.1 GAF domain-containing protein [Chloroflexota bacterium]